MNFFSPESVTTGSANPDRLHYMDNLRAMAMLLGVVFHAALAYSPMLHFFWPSADKQSAASIDVVAWFSHLFRMPLFFLIAGFFAVLLIDKRGLLSFFKNRSMRVLLPLLIFLPLVIISIIAGIQWAGENIKNPSPALNFIYQAMQSIDTPDQPIKTGHLWFLYYLYMFYLLTVLLWKLNFFQAQWLKTVAQPWVLVFIFPLLLIPAFYAIPAPHPAPEGLIPEVWPFGFYGLFFLLGGILFMNQHLLEQLKKYFLWMLFAGIAAYVYFNHRGPSAAGNVLMAITESYISIYITWVCLIAGQKWFNQHSKPFRYVADASYWIYIIHIPVLFFIQYLLLDTEWNMWLEFLLSTSATLAFALLTYALFVRWSPIGWLLNGRRKSFF